MFEKSVRGTFVNETFHSLSGGSIENTSQFSYSTVKALQGIIDIYMNSFISGQNGKMQHLRLRN